MERDFELIRLILMEVKRIPAGEKFTDIDHLTGYDKATVYAHVSLLLDAGLIEGNVIKIMKGINGISISGITWEGYNFIDDIENDDIWKKVTDKIKEKGISVSFDMLQKIIVSVAVKYFGVG